ncbi:MAG: c-type cytochrome [Nitrosomonas sp.]|nr:MAG: c-type cytochrome [Nitrosomonas sp.]
MMPNRHFLLGIAGGFAATLLLMVGFHFTQTRTEQQQEVTMTDPVDFNVYKPIANYNVNLVDPEMAPDDIKPSVMHGFQIMLQTKKNLPQYADCSISCCDCHFGGGNTFGGTNGGISLVGAAKRYPIVDRNGKKTTLADRINGCFLRSMNGTPLSTDSPDMEDMVAFVTWISSVVDKVEDAPWLGLKPLTSKHIPNIDNGREVFIQHCSMCHGKYGQGQEREYNLDYPPLWGDYSFNDGAGMNNLQRCASFVYYNMPRESPILTEEESIDVAAFVTTRYRPHYTPPEEQKAKTSH